MALTNCKECGKEVSTAAEACPNCGNPINPVKKQATKTVVTPTPVEDNAVPKWVIFPVVIIGALILFLLFWMMGTSDNANENVNLRVTQDPTTTVVDDNNPPKTNDTTIVQTDPNIPDTTTQTTTVPTPVNEQQIAPDTKTEVEETVGKVQLEAKFSDKTGKVQTVKDEKFYLLDKDLESILREAKLESINNQNLVNSFGLSVINPDKYGEFNKKALDAINDHVKYDVLTNSAGKAEFGDVEPKNYYLFGIHKVGSNGFAVWSSPVNVKKGLNKVEIQPQRTTEITQ